MVLTYSGSQRIAAISFCLLVVLVAALGLRAIWNGVGRDVAGFPRLSRLQALSLIGLAGLVVWPALVLTSTEGEGEATVPAGWQPRGWGEDRAGPSGDTGVSPPPPLPGLDEKAGRRERLARLKESLWKYARDHGGQFPPSRVASEISDRTWETGDSSRMPYLYIPGSRVDEGSAVVALEPGIYATGRLALLSDGTIGELPLTAISTASPPGGN